MSTTEDKARRIFSKRASFYTSSTCHKDTDVLNRIVDLCKPDKEDEVLDIATGTGHTAFALAPYVHSVIGIDITEEMLAKARILQEKNKLRNVSFQLADAHDLPFPDESFDIVTCRRAPHHFSDIRIAIDEMYRVLQTRGRLVIDDRSVPENRFVDQMMNRLDTLHDESHVRQYGSSEWKSFLEGSGFEVQMIMSYTKHRPLSALTTGVTKENVEEIQRLISNLSTKEEKALNLARVEGHIYMNHWYIMLSAIKI